MIAVSVITGFLGSGKTTLLNHLLGHPDMDRTAVLINEFGEVGLDHLMVRRLDQDVVLLQSGCICCTVKGQLVEGLKELYMKRLAGDMPPFTRVVIETTGLADPLPIISCIMTDPLFKHVFRLDSIITTVDARYGGRQLDDHSEAVRQAAVADRLLLTKIDLTSDDMVAELTNRLRALNPGALLIRAHFGQVAPQDLFGAGFFDLGSKSSDVRRWLNDEAYELAVIGDVQHGNEEHGRGHRHHHADINRHDDHICSFCIDVEQPIPWDVFKQWYEELAEKKGGSLLRVKGIVNVAGQPVPFMIHCVQATQHEPTPLMSWPDENRRSRIVFITHDLPREEIEADLRGRLTLVSAPNQQRTGILTPTSPPDQAVAGRWLNEAELSRLFAALAEQEDRVAADALRLMLLTGVSCNDAREARWEEFDLERRVWLKHGQSAPNSAAKPRPRRIPLGDATLMLLTAMRERTSGKGYLFPGATPDIPVARLDPVWIAAARLAGIDDLLLDELRPALATGLFTGLSPELTRSLMGLRNRGAREVV